MWEARRRDAVEANTFGTLSKLIGSTPRGARGIRNDWQRDPKAKVCHEPLAPTEDGRPVCVAAASPAPSPRSWSLWSSRRPATTCSVLILRCSLPVAVVVEPPSAPRGSPLLPHRSCRCLRCCCCCRSRRRSRQCRRRRYGDPHRGFSHQGSRLQHHPVRLPVSRAGWHAGGLFCDCSPGPRGRRRRRPAAAARSLLAVGADMHGPELYHQERGGGACGDGGPPHRRPRHVAPRGGRAGRGRRVGLWDWRWLVSRRHRPGLWRLPDGDVHCERAARRGCGGARRG